MARTPRTRVSSLVVAARSLQRLAALVNNALPESISSLVSRPYRRGRAETPLSLRPATKNEILGRVDFEKRGPRDCVRARLRCEMLRVRRDAMIYFFFTHAASRWTAVPLPRRYRGRAYPASSRRRIRGDSQNGEDARVESVFLVFFLFFFYFFCSLSRLRLVRPPEGVATLRSIEMTQRRTEFCGARSRKQISFNYESRNAFDRVRRSKVSRSSTTSALFRAHVKIT